MFSIEINSHTLIYLALLVIQHHLPTECLNVHIFNSQSCENSFRSCRAMSGPFSSIVNFTVHQFLQRAKKLSYLHSIKCQSNSNNTSDSNCRFLFPRHHKLSEAMNSKQTPSLVSSSTIPLTVEAIGSTILRAYSYVSRLVCDMNMYQKHQLLPLDKMSKLATLQLNKSRLVDYSCPDKYDSDFDLSSDDSTSEEDEEITENDADKKDSLDDDDDYLSGHLVNISTTSFQGMRVFDSINPTLAKSYFIVNINGTKKYLHKQTAAWLLSKDKPTLSSDRLKRVMTNK